LRKPHPVVILAAVAGWLSAIASPASLFAQVVISEVLFDSEGVDNGRQVIELTNRGDVPAEIGGHWLSFKPAAWRFPAGTSIPAGGFMLVHVNRTGTNTASQLFTGTAGMRSLRRSDAISLFSQNLFSDPTKLLDFVEWGVPGQGGEDVAAEAGKWLPSDPIKVQDLREGSSIARRDTGQFSLAWCIDGSPSLGAPFDGCGPSFSRSPVRLNEISPGPLGWIELKNGGEVAEDLEGKYLFSGVSAYAFPPGTVLLQGEVLLVHIGQSGTDEPGELFTGPQFLPLKTTDSLAFFAGSASSDATLILDFLQWGAAGQPFESIAAQAKLWTAGAKFDATDIAAGGAVAALSEGEGLARWKLDNTPTPGAENDTPPWTPVIINEVLIFPPDGSPAAIELFNRAGVPVDLSNWKLCTLAGPGAGVAACASFPDATVIQPGQLTVFSLRSDPPGGPDPLPVLSPFPAIDPAVGELALAVHSLASESHNLLQYIRWGVGTPVLEEAAAGAGIWVKGEAIDTAGAPQNSSITFDGPGLGPAGYRLDVSPSLGRPNKEGPIEKPFVRGDCNQDRVTDLSDAIVVFGFLFMGQSVPQCLDACDTNNDSANDISDGVFTLGFLFLGGGPPTPPLVCGLEPQSDELSCVAFDPCP